MPQSFVVETELTDQLEMIEETIVFVLVDNLDEVEVTEFVIDDTVELDELEMNEIDETDEDEDSDDTEVEMVELDDIEIVEILEELEVDDEIAIGEMLEMVEELERHTIDEATHTEELERVEMVETHIGEMDEMDEMIIDDAILDLVEVKDDVLCFEMLESEVIDIRVLLVPTSLELIEEVFMVELIDQPSFEKCSTIIVLQDVEDKDEEVEMLLTIQTMVVQDEVTDEMVELEQR